MIAIVRRNPEHNGVEIQFPGKPSPDVLSRLKSTGFRWSFHSKVWYRKDTGSAWAQAHAITGLPLPAAGVDRFDMDVEDRMAEACEPGL